MNREQLREALLAKIEAAWPRYKENPELARRLELASNDELQRHVVMAQAAAEAISSPLPESTEGLPQRDIDPDTGLSRHVHTSKWQLHRYTLAKDECGEWYKGPDWLPFNLHSRTSSCGGTNAERACALALANAAGSQKLWRDIESHYSRNVFTGEPEKNPDLIAFTLPSVCASAKANWAGIPRLTPKKFKEHRAELGHRAEQLALELERFYLPRDPDDFEYPGLLDFMELLNEEECARLDQAIRVTTLRIANRALEQAGSRRLDWDEYNDIGKEARDLGYQIGDVLPPARQDAIAIYQLLVRDHTSQYSSNYGGVPTLPDMLRRIAASFRADGDLPPIKNPNQGTAERSFFARALCKYFWTSFGNVSPAIVRDLVSIFYPESITEGAVSQIIRKVKEGHPLPTA